MKKKSNKYNLVMYVLDSSPKIKRFDSAEKMEKFIKKFQKEYPDSKAMNSGTWIDYCITGVTGEVQFLSDTGVEVQ